MSKPFELGKTYRTQAGSWVKIIEINNTPGYETVRGDDHEPDWIDDKGKAHTLGWRYNREGKNERGRCTGSAHDFSDPRNLIPEDDMSFAEMAQTALILERQRDAAIAIAAQYKQERDSLRTTLVSARTALKEAEDKFWVFHCNAPVPLDASRSGYDRMKQDKDFLAEKSKEMGAAASKIDGVLSVIAK